jgi:pyridoxal phosphate enzyme (YggS family)
MVNIEGNLVIIRKRIQAACLRAGRDPGMVRLIAVSKNFSVEEIKKAFLAGQSFFGENRVQELCAKIPQLPEEIEWHLIGTLQRNKVKNVLGKTALIHSVDSFILAEEISKQAVKKNLLIKVLLQVNIAGEKTKHGFSPQKIIEQIKEIGKLSGIKIEGLMTLAPKVAQLEEVRPVFRQLKMLAQTIEQMQIPGIEMKELSMGMSDDFEVAVEEGATLVRIGSRIFGQRNY